jgi:glycosyltransferase involved in cell wall biosynthesis
MHTLLIHQAFSGPEDAGGTRHYEIARCLAAGGHRFTVVTSTVSYLSGARRTPSRNLGPEGNENAIRVFPSWTAHTLHRSFVWRVFAFLGFMVSSALTGLRTGPVDVVIGTSPPIFQAVSAWLVAVLRSRPFLLEVRDLWPEFAIDMGVLQNRLLIGIARGLERFLYWRATHIIVNSPAYRNYLVDRGVPGEKVSLVPNGADPAMFDPVGSGGDFRRRWNLPDDAFVATYAGALGMANDIPTIIKAAGELADDPSIRVVLVGDGKERARLEAVARDEGLTNVVFTGSVPKSEMPAVLAASDACIATLMDIPMFRTTYPNKVFDYMAAGRPTVLAVDGVIREVVEASEGGIFVQPGNGHELARGIRRLAENRPLAALMGTSARSYVIEHFDRRRQAEEFVTILERFAGK